MNREPNFDELVGTETRGAERERLRGVHELLLQAGPPAELPPHLENAPRFESAPSGVVRLQPRRRVMRRALVLIAAAVSIGAVFAAGYGVGNNRGAGKGSNNPPRTLALTGTKLAPNARATLEVWRSQAGNWPMTLSVVGLQKLPPHRYYEVYLVRNGKPWGSCGTFRIAGSSSNPVTVTLTAPYTLLPGDSWVVTRPGPGGSEPGRTVLRPVAA